MNQPTGVLLGAYGAARGLEDIEAYYTDIRHGRSPTPAQLQDLVDRYRAIGGASPLMAITEQTGRSLQAALEARHGPGVFHVEVAYRHVSPRLADVAIGMADAGVARVLGIALAPHYSGFTYRGYRDPVAQRLDAHQPPVHFYQVPSWHQVPSFIRLLAARLANQLEALGPDAPLARVYFSAHSLPQRILAEGDPYPGQVQATARAVAQVLGLARWGVTWQSAGRTGEAWIGPDILDTLRTEAACGTRVVVDCPAGFVSEHLEVLYDLDVEAARLAGTLGLRFVRTAMPNADPEFIAVLVDVVEANLSRL